MNLQTNVLKRYKEKFPKHTLKEISTKTGIQVTRVFRIMNGSSMKLNEYESFRKNVEESSYKTHEFNYLANKCLEELSESSIKSLQMEMNLLLTIKKQTRDNFTKLNLNNIYA